MKHELGIKNYWKYILLSLLIISLIFTGLFLYSKNFYNFTKPVANTNLVEENLINTNQSDNTEYSDHNSKFILPNSLSLKVPFTPQAPTANWDELHNEACEEASSIMVAQYFAPSSEALAKEDEINLKPEFVEQEIDKLTEWQTKNYNYYLDTTNSETARMIEEVYGLKTELITNFSEDDIKKALAEGKLVILSANGRLLNNPNFKTPGPIHHMIVITGYNKLGFVTNDPGTKRGLNYFYDFETLHNASADWDHTKQTTDTSIKTIIIVSK